MKTSNLFLLSIILFSFVSFGKTYPGKVTESFCGKVDSTPMPKVCFIGVQKESGKKVGLVFNHDEFFKKYGEIRGEGFTVTVNSKLLSKLTSSNEIKSLKIFGKDYFFLRAEIDAIQFHLNSEMEKLAIKMGRWFFPSDLPTGYSAVEVRDFNVEKPLKKWLNQVEQEKLKIWKDFVYESSEFGFLSKEEKEEAVKNPKSFLEVTDLLEIRHSNYYKIYEIYKERGLIGYFLEVTDHIQSAIYQDGAWYELYLDADQNVVRADEESA